MYERGGFLDNVLPEFLPRDVRLQFIIVSIVIPLLLSIIAIITLAPRLFIRNYTSIKIKTNKYTKKRKLVWYIFLLAGTVLFVMAVIALSVNDTLVINAIGSSNVFIFLYIGIAVVVLSILFAVLYRLYKVANSILLCVVVLCISLSTS